MVTPELAAPVVTVIVCAHDLARWDLLRNAVDAAWAEGPDDILVVIDHNDELLRRAKAELENDAAGMRIRVIASSRSHGLSGARNTGLHATDASIVVFIDDDAEPVRGWLGHLLAPFDDDDVAVVGGRALPARPDRFPAWWPHEHDWIVGCSWTGLPETRTDVRNVIGCTMAFRRSSLLATNGFSAELGRVGSNAAGCEETEVCIRIRRTGARVVYEPRATVLHHIDERRLTPRYFVRRCWAEGRSKAIIRRRLGPESLANESRFAIDAVRSSVGLGVQALVRRKPSLFTQAAALAGGVVLTGTAFVTPSRS